MSSKVVLLGICAANRDLLTGWAEEGLLPNYKSAMARGLVAPVESMPGFYVGTTWPSFTTCVQPARHSRHYIAQIEPGTYDIVHRPKGEGIRAEPFWKTLNRADLKVALFDIPHTAPTEGLQGIQVVEWGAHDGDFGRTQTRPRELADEIDQLFGTHPAPRSCDGSKTASQFAAFRDALVSGAARRAEMTRHYLQQGDWDLFAQVWTESHCVGHQCWHLHDPSHPDHDRETAEFVGDPIRDVYVAIDAALGRVLESIDEDTTVLLFTGHGMGPKYDADFLLEDILLRLGYAEPPSSDEATKVSTSMRRHSRVDDFLTRGWQSIPSPLKRLAQPVRRSLRNLVVETQPARLAKIDPAASQCFRLKNNAVHGSIRVNLAGREPGGLVKPGAEFDALCERLAAEIGEIVNRDTGEPIAHRVYRTDSVYAGEYLDYLPDVLIEWNQNDPVRSVESDRIGTLTGVDPYTRTGDHRAGGILIALGPHIRAGRLDRPVQVMDVGPTIARLLGVELQGVDGSPIEEMIRPLTNPAGGV